jgi:hypothetical protein
VRFLVCLAFVASSCGDDTFSSPDLSVGNAFACPEPVAAWCAESSHSCVQDLATATSAGTWCPDGGIAAEVVSVASCSTGFVFVEVGRIDFFTTYVYDAATARLVAVFGSTNASGDRCLAGPASFAHSPCQGATRLCGP